MSQQELEELSERNQLVINEIYNILTYKQEKNRAQQLLELFQKAIALQKRIQSYQKKEENDREVINWSLLNSEQHQSELEAKLARLNKQYDIIQTQIKSLRNYFQLIHGGACLIKRSELLKKSTELLEKQIAQLEVIKSKQKERHESKTIFREIQLKKENEDEEHILEQITQQTNEELSSLELKAQRIARDVKGKQIEYNEKLNNYDIILKEYNEQRIKKIVEEEISSLPLLPEAVVKKQVLKKQQTDDKNYKIMVPHSIQITTIGNLEQKAMIILLIITIIWAIGKFVK